MGVVATDAAEDAVPTIAVDHHDHLFVAYHKTVGANHDLRIWRSGDYGATWIDHVTLGDLDYRYPRLCFVGHGLYMIHCDTNPVRLRLAYSQDYGLTWAHILTISAVPDQLGSLRYDRHGILHLVYKDADGHIRHRYAAKPGVTVGDNHDWTAPALLVDGDAPVFALGVERGYLVYQDVIPVLGSLRVWRTSESYDALRDLQSFPLFTTFESPQWLGLLVDHREYVWLCGKEDVAGSPLRTFFSDNQGNNWTALA